jgi:Mce-associated membrane protein
MAAKKTATNDVEQPALTTDEDVAPPEQPQLLVEQAHHRPLGAWIAISIAVALVALLAASVFIFRSNSGDHDRANVTSVARRVVVALTTYDASSLPTQRQTVLSMATGAFRDEFDKLTGAAFANALTETQATSRGQPETLGVVTVHGDNATVIGIVDVTVQNKDLKTPRVDRQVIQLDMVRTSSSWKVDRVTVLGRITA